MPTLAETQRALVKEAYAAYFKTPTAATKKLSEQILADCTSSATAVLIAARHLLGPTFTAYEPESIWLQTDTCPLNRDKLMAGIALDVMPSFYWDYRVFAATTHALNDEGVSPDSVPQCTPEQMAWSVFEAELLFALNDDQNTRPDYDQAVQNYMAVCLFDEGYVYPPVGLSDTVDELEKMTGDDWKDLRQKTSKAWAELPKDKLTSTKFEDNALGAQLTRLAGCWVYVTSRAERLREELAKFTP